MKDQTRSRVIGLTFLYLSLTSTLDVVADQSHTPAALPQGKTTGASCTKVLVDPRISLDGCGKSLLPPGFDPRTVQPVASRYNDYCVPAYNKLI